MSDSSFIAGVIIINKNVLQNYGNFMIANKKNKK